MSFLTNVYPAVKEKQHYKFVEQQIVSGIADCIQIYYSYTLEPKQYIFHIFNRKCVALHFRFVNVISFEFSQVEARLCLTSGVELDPLKSSNILKIDSLPPKQSIVWTVSVLLKQFTDCQGFLKVFIAINNRWKQYKMELKR